MDPADSIFEQYSMELGLTLDEIAFLEGLRKSDVGRKFVSLCVKHKLLVRGRRNKLRLGVQSRDAPTDFFKVFETLSSLLNDLSTPDEHVRAVGGYSIAIRFGLIGGLSDEDNLKFVLNRAIHLYDLRRCDEALWIGLQVSDEKLADDLVVSDAGLVQAYSIVGNCLTVQRDYEEAEKWLLKAIKKHGKKYDETQYHLQANYYVCLIDEEKYVEAIELLRQARDEAIEKLGMTHVITNSLLAILALCKLKVKDVGGALMSMQIAYYNLRECLGSRDTGALYCLNFIVLLLGSIGQKIEAFEYLAKGTLDDKDRIIPHATAPSFVALFHPFYGAQRPLVQQLVDLATDLDSGDSNSGKRWDLVASRLCDASALTEEWLGWVCHAATRLAKHAIPSNDDWGSRFLGLSRCLVDLLEFEEVERIHSVQDSVQTFYTTYLRAAVSSRDANQIWFALTSGHGRSLSALLTTEEEVHRNNDEVVVTGKKEPNFFKRLGLDNLNKLLDEHKRETPKREARLLELRKMVVQLRICSPSDHSVLLSRFRRKLKKFRDEPLGFFVQSVPIAAKKIELSELQYTLDSSDSLVCLFECQGKCSALVVKRTETHLVSLGDNLNVVLDLARDWRSTMRARSGQRQDSDQEVSKGSGARSGAARPNFPELMKVELWDALDPRLDSIERVHLITHGLFHTLPFELGCSDRFELSVFPGFVYYYAVKLIVREERKISQSSLGVAVNDHANKSNAIPLVNAEERIVRHTWKGDSRTILSVEDLDTDLFGWHLASHGHYSDRNPGESKLLLRSRELNFDRILRMAKTPHFVFISACALGRFDDNPFGEPVGLVGAFLLKGTKYIVAALQPVTDFYMPLFACLFYQSWSKARCNSSAMALEEAKARFRKGCWYEQTEHLVRYGYEPVLSQHLKQVVEHGALHQLAEVTQSWLFPEAYRFLYSDTHQQTLRDLSEELRIEGGCSRFAGYIVDNLIKEKQRLPKEPTRNICHWVRGFGESVEHDI